MTVMANKAPGTLDAVTACSRIANGTGYSADGSTRTIAWALPEEVPIAVQINTQAFVVMMATPADLRDFATGLMISEGIVTLARADPRRARHAGRERHHGRCRDRRGRSRPRA